MLSPRLFSPLLVLAVAALPLSAAPFQQVEPAAALPSGAALAEGDGRVEGDRLVLVLRAGSTPLTAWTHVFLGLDGADTGFSHGSGAPAGTGLDLLLEGDAVYRFAGGNAHVWSWTRLPDVAATRTLTGDTLTLSLPTAALGPAGRTVRAFAATYAENYSATLDTLPRGSDSWTIDLLPGSATAAIAAPPLPRADARAAFKKIRSYACYYGAGRAAELATRDAAIIETRSQTPAEIAALRAAGRLAIGYISIGEDHDLRAGDGRGPGGRDSAYFDRDGDGHADKNGVWNSYFANAASPSWRAFFLGNAARLRASHGVDGFFLDTVETCLLYPESREGMVSLIRELRAAHPDAIIVLNRGWDLLPALGDTVDGLMFESFTLSYDFGAKKYHPLRPSDLDYGLDVWKRLLHPAQEKHGLVVLALDYAASADDPGVKSAYDRSVTLGMVPCVSSIMLDAFYDVAYRGVRDERWLRPQETAESRVLTLKTERNGFPAGTRFSPDSNHGGYSVAPVLDGVASGAAKNALDWSERAWASRESPDEHWLEFALPAPLRATALEIEWAWDNGGFHPARDFRVEIQPAGAAGPWREVARFSGNADETNRVALPDSQFVGLRVIQSASGGGPARPDLMWVQQIRLVR